MLKYMFPLCIVLSTLNASCASTQHKIATKPDCEYEILSVLADSVSEYQVQEQWGHNTVSFLAGAQIVLRPVPGLSKPMLGQYLQCHSKTGPLSIDGVNVAISETDTNFVVTITSKDSRTAHEIVDQSNFLISY